MIDLDVEMVDLESMHVVAAMGYGPEPEYEAWDSILEFARDQRIDPWDHTHRFFGFNNPDPMPDHPSYGYEQWMTVPKEVEALPPLETKDVSGGRYAKTHIRGLGTIGEAWQDLVLWCEEHGYRVAGDREPCLEEVLTPIDQPTDTWEVNLYLAVEDNGA